MGVSKCPFVQCVLALGQLNVPFAKGKDQLFLQLQWVPRNLIALYVMGDQTLIVLTVEDWVKNSSSYFNKAVNPMANNG